MGCAPSFSIDKTGEQSNDLAQWLNQLFSEGDPENLLTAYIEIEKKITKEEGESPAAVLSLYISRQHQMKVIVDAASEKSRGAAPQENSLQEIFADLGLHRGSVALAAEHEEFIANINRRALDLNLIEVLERRSAILREKISSASRGVASLHELYQKQDFLLGRIYGDAYGSEKEMMLEEEIDTIRNYRDAFSSGALLWKDSAETVQNGAQLLSRGVSAWKSVQAQRSVETKISMATTARNAIQEAAILIEISHDSMPAVQFPYCTRRELTSICQAIEYIFTDILIEERYRHALQVYKNFHERAIALSVWINQVFDSTLKKDLEDIDRSICRLSKCLRSERIKIICQKLDMEEKLTNLNLGNDGDHSDNSQFPGKQLAIRALANAFPHSNFHSEFENNLVHRRHAMWPSRTIEQLHKPIS